MCKNHFHYKVCANKSTNYLITITSFMDKIVSPIQFCGQSYKPSSLMLIKISSFFLTYFKLFADTSTFNFEELA